MATRRSLYRGLEMRRYPEDVADDIVTLHDFSEADRGRFPPRPWYHALSWYRDRMPETWERPSAPVGPIKTLALLTGVDPVPATDPDALDRFVTSARFAIAAGLGDVDYRRQRKNRAERALAGLNISRRRYDKLFRLTARLEKEATDLRRQIELADLAMFAKIGLAHRIPERSFVATDSTAAFCAYYVANLSRRSLFTTNPQARALDAASRWLLDRCEASPATGWLAIAHVFPKMDVLLRLTPQERGELLEKATAVLEVSARVLHAASLEGVDLGLMVVRRGADSSTWNAAAGAWNKARDLWLAAAWSLDPSIADAYLPGKVMRLMAADVAAWHRSKGGGVDPDTRVWAVLPKPWEVFWGTATCSRDEVERVCAEQGVDPAKSGWSRPRPRTAVDAVRPTPETVHGVVVANPQLASLLRKAGWFSAKKAHPVGVEVTVERDEHGFAIEAH